MASFSRISVALFLAGCVQPVAARCPDCVVVDAARPRLPRIKRGAERLFVIVPGVLGYGWEWDDAVRALKQARAADYFVFWWEPWGSLHKAARELRAALAEALWQSPPSVKEVLVFGHSVGGLVAAHALDGLPLPEGKRLRVITIGAPFAGMLGPPFSLDDALGSPAMMSVMGTFRDYPAPPPGVEVTEYVTSYPSDPVMQPRYGHQVAPASIGPRGAHRVAVDPRFDHNKIVSKVVLATLKDGVPPETIAP